MITQKDLSTIYDYPVRYSLDLFCPKFSNFNIFYFIHKYIPTGEEIHGWVWTRNREDFLKILEYWNSPFMGKTWHYDEVNT